MGFIRRKDESSPPSALSRFIFNNRTYGVLILAMGLYFAMDERAYILRTGHAGRKSATIPLMISMGLAFVVDPDFRRPIIAVVMGVLGVAGGVVWYWLFE